MYGEIKPIAGEIWIATKVAHKDGDQEALSNDMDAPSLSADSPLCDQAQLSSFGCPADLGIVKNKGRPPAKLVVIFIDLRPI